MSEAFQSVDLFSRPTGLPIDQVFVGIVVTSAPYNADPTGASDSLPAFLKAFTAAGAYGRKVIVPKGRYRWSAPLELSSSSLGFAWKNVALFGEISGSVIDSTEATEIFVDGTDALHIKMDAYGQWQIRVENISFKNEGAKAGTSAIRISTDGSLRSDDGAGGYNYPNGWYIQNVNAQDFESGIRFEATNISTANERYAGLTEIANFQTYECTYGINVDGMILNQFSMRNGMLHAALGGGFRINGGGGTFKLYNVWFESCEPARFVFEAYPLTTTFALHDCDGESNGVSNLDGFVYFAGGQATVPDFILTGSTRLPGGLETVTPRVGQISLSNYTQQSISVVPQGTIIRTPETINVVAPSPSASDFTTASRAFWFGVPFSAAYGAPPRYCPQPIAGHRSSGVAHGTSGVRVAGYPYLSTLDVTTPSVLYVSDVAPMPNPDSKTAFAVAAAMGVTKGGTRFNATWTINDGADHAVSHTMTGNEVFQWTSAEYVTVYGVALRSGEVLNAITVSGVSYDTAYKLSAGYGSWNERTRAINYLIPEGHAQEWKGTAASGGGTAVVRVTGNGSGATAHGCNTRVTVSVNEGALGAGQWIFSGTVGNSASKTQTQIYSAPDASITFAAADGNSADLGTITVTNNTASAVTVRAVIEYL